MLQNWKLAKPFQGSPMFSLRTPPMPVFGTFGSGELPPVYSTVIPARHAKPNPTP